MGSKKKEGPVKWCPRCSRRHDKHKTCDLYARDRVTKSGRVVKRWAH